jgi:hypothetical protein
MHCPIGEVRKLWLRDELQAKQSEIERAEALWKTDFLDACKRIAGANCREQASMTDISVTTKHENSGE